MADVARMRFKSNRSPEEQGELVLNDDGTFRIEPSGEFRDAMAGLEETALNRSRRAGIVLGVLFLSLGALAIGMGWAAGRIFGKLGAMLSEPRSLDEVTIVRDEGGGVHVQLKGVESRFQKVQMGWNGDEILPCEADAFIAKFEEMKGLE